MRASRYCTGPRDVRVSPAVERLSCLFFVRLNAAARLRYAIAITRRFQNRSTAVTTASARSSRRVIVQTSFVRARYRTLPASSGAWYLIIQQVMQEFASAEAQMFHANPGPALIIIPAAVSQRIPFGTAVPRTARDDRAGDGTSPRRVQQAVLQKQRWNAQKRPAEAGYGRLVRSATCR